MGVTRSWNDFFEDDTKDVGENLDEELTDEDRLWAEVLKEE